MRKPRWPLWLWSVQLLPAFALIGVAALRHSLADVFQTDGRMTLLAFGCGLLWALIALGLVIAPRSRRWIVERRKEWFLSAVTLFLGLIVADLALTLLGIVPTIEDQRARSVSYAVGHFTNRRLIPQEVLLDQGDTLRVNTRGFRGEEIAPQPHPERVRIVILGGSQAFDFTGGNWPSLVEAELAELGLKAEVINAGVPGHNTFDSLGKLLTDVWTLKPDILFLCQSWNDIKYFKWIDPVNPYRGLPPDAVRTWRRDWRLHPSGIDGLLTYSALYRKFRWGFAQLLYYEEGLLFTPPPDFERQPISRDSWGVKQFHLNLSLIARLAQDIDTKLVLCKQARLPVEGDRGTGQEDARDYVSRNMRLSFDEVLKAFTLADQTVEEIARDRSLRVSNLHRDLSGRAEYFVDAIHFSPEGSKVAAQLVARSLAEVIAEVKAAK